MILEDILKVDLNKESLASLKNYRFALMTGSYDFHKPGDEAAAAAALCDEMNKIIEEREQKPLLPHEEFEREKGSRLTKAAEKIANALEKVLEQPFKGSWDAQAAYISKELCEYRKLYPKKLNKDEKIAKLQHSNKVLNKQNKAYKRVSKQLLKHIMDCEGELIAMYKKSTEWSEDYIDNMVNYSLRRATESTKLLDELENK